MPSSTRRALLASVGTVGFACVAGCNSTSSDDVPAGSLQFVNEDTLPHELTMQITDVGTEYNRDAQEVVGDAAIPEVIAERQTTAGIESSTTRTYEAVFTEPLWYTVQFTIDDEVPEDGGQITFHPAPHLYIRKASFRAVGLTRNLTSKNIQIVRTGLLEFYLHGLCGGIPVFIFGPGKLPQH